MANNTTKKATTKPATKKVAAPKEETKKIKEATPDIEAPAPDATFEALKEAYEKQIEALTKQMSTMQAQMEKMQTPQIVQIANTEKVHFLWQAEVADDNVINFGDGGMYGRVIGKTGSFFVPKSDLSRIMDSMNRLLLDRRWLIVLSGLTDEEREALGVNYRDGEILDKGAFGKLVDMGDEILDIYPNLCDGHKEIVAKRYLEAWEKKNPNVTRERVVKLNKLGRQSAFVRIIDEMNAEDAN